MCKEHEAVQIVSKNGCNTCKYLSVCKISNCDGCPNGNCPNTVASQYYDQLSGATFLPFNKDKMTEAIGEFRLLGGVAND